MDRSIFARLRRGYSGNALFGPPEDGNANIEATGCWKECYYRARFGQGIIDSSTAEGFNLCSLRWV